MSPEVEVSRPVLHQPTAVSIPADAGPVIDEPDMLDTPEDLAHWPAMADPLRVCDRLILPAFRAADSAALRHQWYHRLLTKLAATCGTGAVLFAILQLAYPDFLGGRTVDVVEVVAAIAALAAVVLGLISGRQSRWLLERHKAERLRLAKFRFLTDPITWSDLPTSVEQRAGELRAQIKRIQDLTPRQFRGWTEEEDVRHEPPSPQDRPSAGTLDQLVDYYRTKRMEFQRDFFRKRAEKHELFDRSSRHLGPLLFLGSVIAALTHFGIDLFHDGNGLHAASTQLILLAAALPVVGAGIRTLRTAYEFARNTSRYRAKSFVLDRLVQILQNETDSWSKLRELWYSEEILEFEHREWCRLMIEAEWLP